MRAQARPLGPAAGETGLHAIAPPPLGRLLAEARTARGLSARALAAAIGASHRTVARLERGERRVSPAMLASLAVTLAPDDPDPLCASLTAAAGDLLVPDSPGGVRRRERRMRRMRRVWQAHGRREAYGRMAMQRQAGALMAEAFRVLDDPAALDDPVALERTNALLDASRRLQDEAGPPIGSVFAGGVASYSKPRTRRDRNADRSRPQKATTEPAPLLEPARDAPWPVIDRYLKEKARRELGVTYDE